MTTEKIKKLNVSPSLLSFFLLPVLFFEKKWFVGFILQFIDKKALSDFDLCKTIY